MFEAKYQRYITHNVSRFAEKNEILKQSKRFSTDQIAPPAGVPLYYINRSLYVDNSDNHTAIVGPTGCKKSRVTAFTTLATIIKAGESAIVNDPKGEIYRKTAQLAKNRGASVRVLNIRKPRFSNRWNPFSLPYSLYHDGRKEEAVQMINDITETLVAPAISKTVDRYWGDTCKQFFIAICLALLVSVPDEYYHFANIIQMCFEDNDAGYKAMVKNMDKHTTAAIGIHAVADLQAEKTKSCVYSSLMAILSPITQNSGLMDLLSGDDIDIEEIGKNQTIVYIIYPDEKANADFLVNMFLTQCYEALVNLASNYVDDRLPIRVNFVLDEFSNLTPINNFENRISEARSKNIRYFLFMQSFEQLKIKYKENAETILANCNNWICFGSKDIPFLEKLSKICGQEIDYNGREHPLVSPAEMQQLHKTDEYAEVLIIKQGLYPYITKLPDYTLLPVFKSIPETSVLLKRINTFTSLITFQDWIDGIDNHKFKYPFYSPSV